MSKRSTPMFFTPFLFSLAWSFNNVRDTWTINKLKRNYPEIGRILHTLTLGNILSFNRQPSSILLALTSQYCNKDIISFGGKNSGKSKLKSIYEKNMLRADSIAFKDYIWKKARIITLAHAVDPCL
ncbi:hypothetical protein EDC96DRAFT_276724 [Choanephora cucurbitarum]|nr:hypothetical protein EDC96DRAFT_276724 [Choanephora cucurbitarum]